MTEIVIKNNNFAHYRNDEHFEFMTEVKLEIERKGASLLKIDVPYTKFVRCYEAEDEALKIILKSIVTDSIGANDVVRKTSYRGITYVIKGMTCSYIPEIAQAAHDTNIVAETYGSLSRKPINEASSAIYNFVQDVRMKHFNDIKKLGLEDWINKLDEQNELVKRLVMQRTSENAAKLDLNLKHRREDTDAAYIEMAKYINAISIVDGNNDLTEVINEINVIIDKYTSIRAQRAGRAKARRNK